MANAWLSASQDRNVPRRRFGHAQLTIGRADYAASRSVYPKSAPLNNNGSRYALASA
jgi:hypothetical protein